MCMDVNSGEESNRSYSKSEFQMFSLLSGCHVGVPRRGTNTASPYCNELHKFAWNFSANNSRTVYCTDLRLGEVVSLLIFYNV